MNKYIVKYGDFLKSFTLYLHVSNTVESSDVNTCAVGNFNAVNFLNLVFFFKGMTRIFEATNDCPNTQKSKYEIKQKLPS